MSRNKSTNETINLLLDRASVRNFTSQKIEPEILDQILAAGVQSASGGNLQPYSIIVIENEKTNRKLADKCSQKFIGQAPVNLLFCIDMNRMQMVADTGCAPYSANHAFRHFWISFQDTIIAAQSICTAADALGLGSCYIGTIMEFMPELIEMCKLPSGVFPVVLLTMGYPAVQKRKAAKFPAELMIHRETYQQFNHQELFNAYLTKNKNAKIDINDSKLAIFEENCLAVGGRDFAERCLEQVKEQGYLNPVQYRYGLHYPAGEMPDMNLKFMEILKNQGLDIFSEWQPVVALKVDLWQQVADRIESAGLESGLEYYAELKKEQSKFRIGEEQLNMTGYQLMNKGLLKEAIAVFKLNLELFPGIAYNMDSLAEAYLKNGDRELAIEQCKLALAINPDLASCIEMLKELEES